MAAGVPEPPSASSSTGWRATLSRCSPSGEGRGSGPCSGAPGQRSEGVLADPYNRNTFHVLSPLGLETRTRHFPVLNLGRSAIGVILQEFKASRNHAEHRRRRDPEHPTIWKRLGGCCVPRSRHMSCSWDEMSERVQTAARPAARLISDGINRQASLQTSSRETFGSGCTKRSRLRSNDAGIHSGIKDTHDYDAQGTKGRAAQRCTPPGAKERFTCTQCLANVCRAIKLRFERVSFFYYLNSKIN